MRGFLMISACLALMSCGSSGTAIPQPMTFGLEKETKIELRTVGASQDLANSEVGEFGEYDQFWVKAHEEGLRVIRFGRKGTGSSAKDEIRRHNYRIPLSEFTFNGVTLQAGAVAAVNENVPNKLAGRLLTVSELPLDHTIAGVLGVIQCCDAPGFIVDAYGYIGGVAATDIPTANANVEYTGGFFATVLENGEAVEDVALPMNLSVNFHNENVSGTIGDEITLSGTVLQDRLFGSATVTGTELSLSQNSFGQFSGNVFGPGGTEAAGIVEIASPPGDNPARLVGVFGAQVAN